MADAIITDINEYRARKETNSAAAVVAFSGLSDTWLKMRYKVLLHVENGVYDPYDTSDKLAQIAFPNGYDPVNHPEDNFELVLGEMERRGVLVS